VNRHSARRVVTGAALLLAAGLVPLVSSPAHADDSTTLTVVGTSDVFDSNLVTDVIQPGFEAAYPGITFNYVSKGTGAAIAYAEAGTASALLVHAASLENQFVQQGYSLEPYGRAIFWGDYVLLGPPSDPAHVMSGKSSENIVQAFQKIAAAGADGKANFVSRGGTPGTTVQEHAIWALTHGVTTCAVSDANGGGTSPSTTTGACPDTISYPDWYHATGLTQAPNILNGDVCNYPTGGSGSKNNCYVLTDRGTFNYLQTQAGALGVHTLKVVTDNNDQAPASQQFLLVNSFHLYGVNPAAVPNPSAINTTAATDLLTWLTSPAAQTAVKNYLSTNGAGGPFHPDAAPSITTSAIPGTTKVGDDVTLSGAVTNVVPGTPPLNGVTVTLTQTVGSTTSVVGSGMTSGNGKFSLPFTLAAGATYQLSTPAITKTENDQLNPIFADELQPATRTVSVQGVATLKKAKPVGSKKVEVKGTVAPVPTDSTARLELWAAHPGKSLTMIASHRLTSGSAAFDSTFKLGTGKWKVKVKYVDPGVVRTGSSAAASVTLG
jgi:tungstate transport system substrate-binding protein